MEVGWANDKVIDGKVIDAKTGEVLRSFKYEEMDEEEAAELAEVFRS